MMGLSVGGTKGITCVVARACAASKRAREFNLNVDVVDGKDLAALESALSGLPFNGTSIRGE